MSLPIITQAEAARLSIAEIHSLHNALSSALAECVHGSLEAQEIAASLRTIMRELNRRNRLSRTPAFGRSA